MSGPNHGLGREQLALYRLAPNDGRSFELQSADGVAASSLATAVAAWVIAIGVALYALRRLGLWMEERGWIYDKKKHGSSGTLSSAVLEVQTLLEPSKRHVLELKRRDESEQDESGDPPPDM